MKSVENILGYIREQFYRFSRGCKPRENLWKCSRKYTKMFKTSSFLSNKKLNLNQRMFGVIMPLYNRMFCCIFGWYFYIEIRLKYEKIFCSALEIFIVYPLFFVVYPEQQWGYIEKSYKMQQMAFASRYLLRLQTPTKKTCTRHILSAPSKFLAIYIQQASFIRMLKMNTILRS